MYSDFPKSKSITFFDNGQPLDFDAFISWGYMSPKHMRDYEYLVNAIEAAGKVTLHSSRADRILQSKLL